MFSKRVLTAIIGIPATIYIIQYGQWLFFATIALLAVASWHEFCTMLRVKKTNLAYYPGIFGILLLLGCAWLGNPDETMGVLFITILLLLGKMVIGHKNFSVQEAVYSIFGIGYIGLAFSYLILLRSLQLTHLYPTLWGSLSAGIVYLWLPFIGTWANDTAAFLVGSRWGKQKLCPAISPGKTVEGALGGLVGSVAALAGIGSLVFGIPVLHTALIGCLVGVAAPVGDLAESAFKRFCGVKDSGSLLPGHGGVLDRFDSIMFTAPLVYYYIQLFLI